VVVSAGKVMLMICCYDDALAVTVNIVAGEMLSVAGPFLEQQMHPTVIIGAFRQALDDLLTILKDQVSIAVDITNSDEMRRIIKSCIGTKFITKWSVGQILLHICASGVNCLVLFLYWSHSFERTGAGLVTL